MAVRIDAELFKIEQRNDGLVAVRITLQPFKYEHITFTPRHKKWNEYSEGRASELLITERRLFITFVISEEKEKKPLGERFMASDLNFATTDSTIASLRGNQVKLEDVRTEPIKRIAQIQNDFSRRRRRIQLHVKNPKKRSRKLRTYLNR